MLEFLEDNAVLIGAIILVCIALIILVAAISVFRRNAKANSGGVAASAGANRGASNAVANNPFSVVLAIDPRQRSVVGISGDMSVLCDITNQQILANPYSLNYALSDDARHLLEETFETWDRVTPFTVEVPLNNEKTNKTIQCKFTCRPDAQTKNWLVELRDITDVRAEINDLQQLAATAQEGEKAKLRFLSDMSHEIRTPMNGIMGSLALARIHVEESERVSGYLDQADDLTQYLLSIINNVLDISKIENEKMELEERCFSLNDVLERMRNLFGESTKTKGINYYVRGDIEGDAFVVGDELRLVQVLTNLVSNAQKFTPENGSITVELVPVQLTDDLFHFMIRVADTGKGMSKDFLKTIFDPFSQESSSTSRKFGGTGLGMAISDQMVRLMGGHIIVESELGKGSTFEVYLGLPIANQEQIDEYLLEQGVQGQADADSDAPKLFTLEGSRILMAEDNLLNATIAEEMLKESGAALVELAGDGVIVCDKFAQSEPGTYDIILMDIQMPNRDGREAARTIRAMDHPEAQTIPIIALSADAYVEDKHASRKAGMNGHIAKPIVYETLEAQICAELSVVSGGDEGNE